jgi:signal transduction histidine kinase
VTGEAVIQTSERDTAQGRRTFECRTYPIFGPDGSPAFALHSVRDVTEQREMERALRRQREQLGRMLREVRRAGRRNDALNAQLLQAEKMASLGQMASMMAHDLDTPLSTIMGYAQVLGSCADEEERRRHLRKIAEQAARCHQIIRRTLDFARQPRAQAGPVDLNAVVRQVTTLLEHPIRAKRAMLEHDLAEPAPVLRGDEHSLTQLCFNLVRNALDAVQPNGRVVVRTRRRDSGSVRLEVEDNGHGLTPEAMERLFTPFFTTKPPGQGTGLGLTICRSIARAHGGTIRAENREGGGARFVVELPAGDANTAARADAVG